MWQYFFKFQTDIPKELYVANFSPTHIAWFIAAFALIFLIVIIYRKQNTKVRRRIEISIGVILICSYVFRWIWTISLGQFTKAEWPLHLCAMSAAMEVIAVFSRRPLFKEFGYALGMPGGLTTFLMPGEPYPLFHFYYLFYILTHLILILLPIIWVWNDGFRPSLNRLWRCFLILLAMAGADVIINTITGSNFMFLNYAPDNNPLKAAADWAGNPGYQFYMFLILLGVWIILYTPWIIIKKVKQNKLSRIAGEYHE